MDGGEEFKRKTAYKVLKKHFKSLCKVVTRGDIIEDLYAHDIIDEDTIDMARMSTGNLTNKDKGTKIVRMIQKAVQIRFEVFDELCDILKKEGPIAEEVEHRLRSDYTELVSSGTEPNEDLCRLKTELKVFNSCLAKPNATQISYDMIKESVSHYVETSMKAGETSQSLKQQMRALCHQDLLIPSTLQDWAIAQPDEITTSIPPTGDLLTDSGDSAKAKEVPQTPVFCKETLYHASLCCHAVGVSSSQKLSTFLGPQMQLINHRLEEASMSLSEGQVVGGMTPYLIAVQKSIIYVAFRGEASLMEWSKKYSSFEDGLRKQSECVPLRFFIEQLRDKKKIVLTGFSFGGMLATFVAAKIWKMSYISKFILVNRVVSVTFGQPMVTIPYVQDIAKEFPTFGDTVHSIFSMEDMIPRILSASHQPYSTSSAKSSGKLSPSLTPKIPLSASAPSAEIVLDYHGFFPVEVHRNMALLQEASNTQYSTAVRTQSVSRRSEMLANLKVALKEAPVTNKQSGDLVGIFYKTSLGEEHGPKWTELPRNKVLQELGNVTAPEVDCLEANLFQNHNMESYKNSMFRSHVDREPGKYSAPDQLKEVKSVGFLKPTLTAMELHKYPNEHVIVLEGDNLWFCHHIQLGEGDHTCSISTPAQNITQRSIQFKFTPSPKSDFTVDREDRTKVTLHSHFAKTIRQKIPVKQEPYSFSQRQMQLAKHTPSEVIKLAYWSAMLEYNSHNEKCSPSNRFKAVTQFLEEAVRVVPIESIIFAIAYGDDSTSRECSEAAVKLLPHLKLPPSQLMINAALSALFRIETGVHPSLVEAFAVMLGEAILQELSAVGVEVSSEEAVQAVQRPTYSEVTQGISHTEPTSEFMASASLHPMNGMMLIQQIFMTSLPYFLNAPVPQVPQRKVNEKEELVKFLNKIFNQGAEKVRRDGSLDVVCGLNIDQVYPIFPSRRSTLYPSTLQSPVEILKQAREKLSSLAKQAQDEESSPSNSQAKDTSKVEHMLSVVREIQDQDLKICISLLGVFMELQIRIPLLNTPVDTAKILSSNTAPVAMGVWALFSMSCDDLRYMLQRTEGNALLIEIDDYITGIYSDSDKPSQIDDSMYAGKLQFLLQGMKKTTTCSSQYISYSLEHQLCNNLKFDKSTRVNEMIERWDEIFKGDALSLVSKPYRPLIARWLKWALLIHDLRESLAKYTCVGVIGLVNSGKSQLVNTLFKVQALVGTTGKARTTVPFLYNLDGIVDGLDVIDFPGVDDSDHCIPELAKLLVGLAQIVVFVVDYRKISNDLAKIWLRELQLEDVPLMVCLTHADRLYAECMRKESESDPEPTEFKRQEIGTERQRIIEELGHHPSRTVEFCCFCNEPDSKLTPEYLKDVGIKTPEDVGDWLVDTFKSKFDQATLADKLHEFIHGAKNK